MRLRLQTCRINQRCLPNFIAVLQNWLDYRSLIRNTADKIQIQEKGTQNTRHNDKKQSKTRCSLGRLVIIIGIW